MFFGNAEGVLLRQRSTENTAKNWWKGMWELPRATVQDSENAAAAIERLLREMKIEAEIGGRLKSLKHGVTTHAITLDCYEIHEADFTASEARLFTWAELKDLAIPSTMRKLLDWLYSNHVINAQLALL